MATYSETQETRLIFNLYRDNEYKARVIAIPGAVASEQTLDAVLAAFKTFSNSVTTIATGGVNLSTFIQPVNWRDETGSSITSDDAPWQTDSVEIEFYTTTKTRYTQEEVQ